MSVTVTLSGPAPWGFRISGGRDFGKPIAVSQVAASGKAAAGGLRPGDVIVSINGERAAAMLHVEAQNKIKQSPGQLRLQLERCLTAMEPLALAALPWSPGPTGCSRRLWWWRQLPGVPSRPRLGLRRQPWGGRGFPGSHGLRPHVPWMLPGNSSGLGGGLGGAGVNPAAGVLRSHRTQRAASPLPSLMNPSSGCYEPGWALRKPRPPGSRSRVRSASPCPDRVSRAGGGSGDTSAALSCAPGLQHRPLAVPMGRALRSGWLPASRTRYGHRRRATAARGPPIPARPRSARGPAAPAPCPALPWISPFPAPPSRSGAAGAAPRSRGHLLARTRPRRVSGSRRAPGMCPDGPSRSRSRAAVPAPSCLRGTSRRTQPCPGHCRNRAGPPGSPAPSACCRRPWRRAVQTAPPPPCPAGSRPAPSSPRRPRRPSCTSARSAAAPSPRRRCGSRPGATGTRPATPAPTAASTCACGATSGRATSSTARSTRGCATAGPPAAPRADCPHPAPARRYTIQ